MPLSITRQLLRAGAAALVLSTVTSVSMFVSADAAYAERGGNGNSNKAERSAGRSENASANRSSNSNSNRSSNASAERANNGNANRDVGRPQVTGEGGNGRGVLARELRGLNAAHASQTALENASPNSMPGKLYIYQQEQPELRANEATAMADVERLTSLSAADIAAAYPDGEYAAALDAADGDPDALATLQGLSAADIAATYPDGAYAAALDTADGDPVALATLQSLSAEEIAAQYPGDTYAAAVDAADGDPDALATLQGLSAADIAAQYPEGEYAAAVDAADGDSETLAALQGLSSVDIALDYPDGDYAAALATADEEYQNSQQAIIDSILALSGDRELSDDALAELDRLLGL